jgi:hypothetical protein
LQSAAPIEVGQSIPDREGGTDGTIGVIVVRPRHAEHRHDRIPDEFLDGPTVGLKSLAHCAERAAECRADHLSIVAPAERGRPYDVYEDDGDELALLDHAPSL